MHCPACSQAIPKESRYCPECGNSLSSSDVATRLEEPRKNTVGASPGSKVSSASWLSASSADSGSRFTSGVLLADRYRIVGLLGRGGMGEVYRADDLKLEQPVALKFLPPELASDPARLDRFKAEVRIARRVAHPNVCRVYDIGEINGQHFLSMEYIDGENLSSLFRRIGRLPEDKALEIARQLCAGLQAAHQQGVLHRDLKPANVMLDGQGKVRITDFGLANLIEEGGQEDVRSGTPAYMAPEQLEGREASKKSDIFALGLVLFEIFTGRRFFDARDVQELLEQQKSLTSTSSRALESVDPAVERIILRCLDWDPAARPESAIQVVMALPGGDPLAAALEAGETPSPELVAAAGSDYSMPLWLGVACLLFVIAGAAATLPLDTFSLWERIPDRRALSLLVDDAQQLVSEFDYSEAPGDFEYGFEPNWDFLNFVQRERKSADRWDILNLGSPPGVLFWYRQSLRPLATWRSRRVSYTDPPRDVAGMASLRLDTQGRLVEFLMIPPAPGAPDPVSDIDWGALFTSAGLDPASFEATQSDWTPPVYSDGRRTWEGTSDATGTPIRVEAGTYRGRLVYFKVFESWTREERVEVEPGSLAQTVYSVIAMGVFFAILLIAILLAHRNIQTGRWDRTGALRVSGAVLIAGLVSWILSAHHAADLSGEAGMFMRTVSELLFGSVLTWLLYVALEPYLRRRWPHGVVTWNRVLAGRFRDPQIGRDLLFGSAFGVTVAILAELDDWILPYFGSPASMPELAGPTQLLGIRYIVGANLQTIVSAILSGLTFFFLLMVLRLIFKRDWIAIVAVLALGALPNLSADQHYSTSLLFEVLLVIVLLATILVLLLRFGLLAGIFAFWSANTLLGAPLTTDLTSWHSGPTLFAVVVVSAAALAGFLLSVDRTRLSIPAIE